MKAFTTCIMTEVVWDTPDCEQVKKLKDFGWEVSGVHTKHKVAEKPITITVMVRATVVKNGAGFIALTDTQN